MLTRRLHDPYNPLPQYFRDHQPALDAFGGIGVLNILTGTLDAAIDPVKGQPPYEAYIWGVLAEKAGLVVRDASTGKTIDWKKRIPAYSRGEPWASKRIPIIIAKDIVTAKKLLQKAKYS